MTYIFFLTGQSTSGGVDVVAVIISVTVIILLCCISLPICVICLTIALVCTCRKYRKMKKLDTVKDSKTETLLVPSESGSTSVHQLPLPPVPAVESVFYETIDPEPTTEMNRAYGSKATRHSELRMEANRAYDLEVAYMEPNRAYGSTVETKLRTEANGSEPIATETNEAYNLAGANKGANLVPARAELANNSGIVVEPNQAYELKPARNADDMKMEENEAYCSGTTSGRN
jgi:hypothetical protein